MRTDRNKKGVFGVKKKIIGGKMRTVINPRKRRQHGVVLKSLLYKDNRTNLSGPIVGGNVNRHNVNRHSIQNRISRALTNLRGIRHGGRVGKVRYGGCINQM